MSASLKNTIDDDIIAQTIRYCESQSRAEMLHIRVIKEAYGPDKVHTEMLQRAVAWNAFAIAAREFETRAKADPYKWRGPMATLASALRSIFADMGERVAKDGAKAAGVDLD